MKPHLPLAFTLLLYGLLSPAQTRPPSAFTTPPKTVAVYVQQPDKPALEIHGKAALTVTAANPDDTVTGTFIYALSDEARQILAKLANQPLNDIPALLTKKDVRASFQKNSACPWLRWELDPATLDIKGLQLRLKPVVLELPETREYLNQLFCNWARQINVNRQRRGIIAAINRALTGDEQ
ncbi:MAG: hypothetical protein HYR56_09530 [Acidobacteria bacterium]|nr:hypothetical protein [Acidobacteriota bacterium]MBI3424989.1 hypothetical protein [Acidobacteriota bacterium]